MAPRWAGGVCRHPDARVDGRRLFLRQQRRDRTNARSCTRPAAAPAAAAAPAPAAAPARAAAPAPPPDPASTGSAPAPAPAPSFGQRMTSLFSRPAAQPAPVPQPAEPGTVPAATTEVQCPGVEIRQGASTMSFSTTTPGDPSALGLRYQVTISRTARDCLVRGNMLTIRIGMEGRIILGPAGGPGHLEVPVRYAVVQEGPDPRPSPPSCIGFRSSFLLGKATWHSPM